MLFCLNIGCALFKSLTYSAKIMFQNLVCQFSDEQQAFIVKGKLEKGKIKEGSSSGLRKFWGAPV